MDNEPPRISSKQKTLIIVVVSILLIAIALFLSIGNATT
jgi:hypothetical protein